MAPPTPPSTPTSLGSFGTELLAFRVRLQRLFHFSEEHSMLLWAALSGVLGALTTVVFRDGIRIIQTVLTGHPGSLVEMAESLSMGERILLPAIGGALAGGLLVLAREHSSAASSEYMEAISLGDGAISVRLSLLRSASSLLTISSGGSIGREGSMVQLAAMTGSILGRLKRLDPQRLRLLVACGAAAGLSAAYSAPIAGALFISEIVLGSISMNSFGPILVASVMANITMRELPGYRPVYQMPDFPEIHGVEVIYFVVLGIVCGLLSSQFLKLLRSFRTLFDETGWPAPARLALGGLGVGIISVWQPEVWGNGYSVVNSLLHSSWAWQAVVVLLLLKVLATALTTGSGAIGGVFTPSLFVGAAIGYLTGVLVHVYSPGSASPPFAYAVVGMGAFLAAATSAPFMAMLMISEMTVNYDVMVPLMLSCVVAYFVARSIDETSMYEITAKRRRDSDNLLRLRQAHMRDLTQPADTVLLKSASFAEVSQMFLAHPVKYIYVVDEARRYLGAIALQDLTSALLGDMTLTDQGIERLVQRDRLPVISPGLMLSEALELFLQHQGERLPVVDEKDHQRLLGVVYKSQLLETYSKLNVAS